MSADRPMTPAHPAENPADSLGLRLRGYAERGRLKSERPRRFQRPGRSEQTDRISVEMPLTENTAFARVRKPFVRRGEVSPP